MRGHDRRNLLKKAKKGENERKRENQHVERNINISGLVEQRIERTGQNGLFRKTVVLAATDQRPFHGGSLTGIKEVWKNELAGEGKFCKIGFDRVSPFSVHVETKCFALPRSSDLRKNRIAGPSVPSIGSMEITMNNLWENTKHNIQGPFAPEKGNPSAPTYRFLEHPGGGLGEGDLDRVSRRLEVKTTADGRRKRLVSGQLMLPGLGSSNQPPIANLRFTFDQFVVGPCNRFAFQAARAVANEKRNAYNPLYLYSGSGLGKSHLSGAIGNHIHGTEPASRIVYATAEQFVNEMVSAIRKNEMWEFKEKYRKHCDILFVDGVHFFSGKEKTQTELSHTFDHLYNFGKKIILTGTVPPHELNHMTDSLKSRLGGGLVVDIQPPDLETRRRILRHKAEFDGVALPEDVVDFLASRVCSNIRRLEGLLINLMAKSSLLFRPIDLELAQEVVGALQVAETQKVTIDSIQKLVARQYHLEVEQLVSRSRRKSICFPRQLAMYLCRKLTHESLDAIGKAYRRDHASVIHSIGVIEKQIREKAQVRREVDFLVEKLRLQGRMAS